MEEVIPTVYMGESTVGDIDERSMLIGEFILIKKSGIDIIQNPKIFQYPDATFNQVTLGSQVEVHQLNENFTVNIVGIPMFYKQMENENNYFTRPSSPLAKAIIGKRIGEIALIKSLNQKVEIVKINQSIIKSILDSMILE